MVHGVIPDTVAGRGDAAAKGRLVLDVRTDEEEGRANIVPGEQVQQVRRDGGVGSIVEGEGNLTGIRRSDQVFSAELRTIRKAGPRRERGSCGEHGCCPQRNG
jgi:hypothetical protein